MKKSAIGLVSALVLSSTSAFAANGEYSCWGTEPFWNLNITTKTIKVETPDYAALLKPATIQTPSNRNPGQVMVVQTKPISGYKITPVTVVIMKQPCNDGMSDTGAPYTAVYIQGSEVMEGCCK